MFAVVKKATVQSLSQTTWTVNTLLPSHSSLAPESLAEEPHPHDCKRQPDVTKWSGAALCCCIQTEIHSDSPAQTGVVWSIPSPWFYRSFQSIWHNMAILWVCVIIQSEFLLMEIWPVTNLATLGYREYHPKATVSIWFFTFYSFLPLSYWAILYPSNILLLYFQYLYLTVFIINVQLYKS